MYERILAVVTAEASALHALDDAVDLARDQGGDLVVLVIEPPATMWDGEAAMGWPSPLPGAAVQMRQAAQQHQQRLVKRARDAGVPMGVVRMQGQDVAALAMEAARLHRCDVVVVGTDGQGMLSRVLFGSPLPSLITDSPIPVLVSTPTSRRPRRRRAARGGHRAPLRTAAAERHVALTAR